jgi:ketosteroid isomerase-like protein
LSEPVTVVTPCQDNESGQPGRGRESALAFFQSLAARQLQTFEVKHVLAEGNLVVATLDVEGVAVATDKRFVEQDEVHLWHFNACAEVQRFRHVVDTLQHWRACQP